MDTFNIENKGENVSFPLKNFLENLNNCSSKYWHLIETSTFKTKSILTEANLLINEKDKDIQQINKKILNLPLSFPKNAKAIDFLNLFFDEEVWNLLLSETNVYASQILSENKKKLKSNSRYKEWKPVTYREIQIFHGIILWNGLLSNKDLNDNWSSNVIFQTNHGKYMSNNRFHLINSFLHLNNNENNHNKDPLHKLRPLITMLNSSFENFYGYDEKLCIDECMIKFNGSLSFKQYIPSKSTKHGIKGFLLCNSVNYYCYQIEIYTGKNEFYKKDNFSSIEQCVIRLCRNVFDKYKIVYMDSYYTTINLGLYFIQRKTGMIGTMRENRTHLLKQQIPKKKGDYKLLLNVERNLTLTAIFDKKVVFVLSNVTIPKMIKVYSKKKGKISKYCKPNVIAEYNSYSKGVDFCNRRTVNYRYPHKNMKWWKSVYYHLFHLCLNNAFVLYNEFYQLKIDYKDFYVEIIKSLLGEKKKNKKEKQYHLVNYIDKQKKSVKRLRCRLCSSLTCWKCKSCSVGNYICSLCIPNCFEQYHEKKYSIV